MNISMGATTHHFISPVFTLTKFGTTRTAHSVVYVEYERRNKPDEKN